MGQIITFYSYKGGTGRSMAMANVAWILASRGKRVLAIDWDLEAPGLHRYFSPFLVDKDVSSTEGVIDFIRSFAVRAAKTSPGTERSADWYKSYADIADLAVSLRWDYFRPGVLDFVPAGKQDGGYATRVNSFNWDVFYEKIGGGAFLDAMKETILGNYDYILVDSRTGVSDTSGICTVHMPDTVVVCFTLNNQNIQGASAVAQSIAQQRVDATGKSRVRILPIATRVDNFEKRKLDRRRSYARERFAPFLEKLPPSYWSDVEIPYWPYYAYEELLATFGDESGDANTVLSAFERLTGHLTGNEINSLVPPPAEERTRVLALFEEIPNAAQTQDVPAAATASNRASEHYDLYLSIHPAETHLLTELQPRFAAAYLDELIDSSRIWQDPLWGEALPRAIADSRGFAYCEGALGTNERQLRELAFALEHQRKQHELGRAYPILLVLLPTVRTSVLESSWLGSRAIDLRRHGDNTSLNAVTRQFLDGKLPSIPVDAIPCGTGSVQEWDAPFFAPRDAELERLMRRVQRGGLVFLRGSSGSGKTSLINAALLPNLRRQTLESPIWEVASLAPGTNPMLDLSSALSSLWSSDTRESTRVYEATNVTRIITNQSEIGSILELAYNRTPRFDRLLIAVDQVERLFTTSQPADRQQFLNALSSALAYSRPATILISIRPEYEEALTALKPDWAWALADGLDVPPISAPPEDASKRLYDYLSRLGALDQRVVLGALARMVEIGSSAEATNA